MAVVLKVVQLEIIMNSWWTLMVEQCIQKVSEMHQL